MLFDELKKVEPKIDSQKEENKSIFEKIKEVNSRQETIIRNKVSEKVLIINRKKSIEKNSKITKILIV